MTLYEEAASVEQALGRLADIHDQFQHAYRGMLARVAEHGKPVAVCTVYDAIPGLARTDRAGLCVFNDIILREAFRIGAPVIDLRLICADRDDYAPTSPIEPSAVGGGKIARAISRLVLEHDFRQPRSGVFA